MFLSYNPAKHLCLALSVPVVYCFYDLETTGLDINSDRIINFAAKKVIYDGAGSFIDVDSMDILINPGFPLPRSEKPEYDIPTLTGITDEKLRDKPYETDVFPIIKDFMDGCIPVGFYNRRYDNLMMNEMYRRCGETDFNYDFDIDVYEVAKVIVMDGETTNRKLKTYVTELHIVDDDHKFHTAAADVDATEKLLQYLIPKARKNVDMIYPHLIKNKVKRLKYYDNRTRIMSKDAWKGNCVYVATDNGDFKFMEYDNAKPWQCSTSDRIERYDVDDMTRQCMEIAHVNDIKNFVAAVKTASGGILYPEEKALVQMI